MDSVIKKPQEVQQPQVFSNEDEIKILEQRLQLLREGTEEKASATETTESKESAEAVEGGVGEVSSGAPFPPESGPTPFVQPDQHYHDSKVGELKTYESDKQIKALVEIAFERSVADAVDIARRLDDAHLLDDFHATLQDDTQVRSMLIESGKLKEV